MGIWIFWILYTTFLSKILVFWENSFKGISFGKLTPPPSRFWAKFRDFQKFRLKGFLLENWPRKPPWASTLSISKTTYNRLSPWELKFEALWLGHSVFFAQIWLFSCKKVLRSKLNIWKVLRSEYSDAIKFEIVLRWTCSDVISF